jgi:hypothetical protein
MTSTPSTVSTADRQQELGPQLTPGPRLIVYAFHALIQQKLPIVFVLRAPYSGGTALPEVQLTCAARKTNRRNEMRVIVRVLTVMLAGLPLLGVTAAAANTPSNNVIRVAHGLGPRSSAPSGFKLVASANGNRSNYWEASLHNVSIADPLDIDIRVIGGGKPSGGVLVTCKASASTPAVFKDVKGTGLFAFPVPVDATNCKVSGTFEAQAVNVIGVNYTVQVFAKTTTTPTTPTTTTTSTIPSGGTTTTIPLGGTTTTTTIPTKGSCPVEILNCKYPYDGSYSGTIGGTIMVTASGGEGGPSVVTSDQIDAPILADVVDGVVMDIYSGANAQNVIVFTNSVPISNSGLATGLEFEPEIFLYNSNFDWDSDLSLSCSSFSIQFNATGAETSNSSLCTGTDDYEDSVQMIVSVNLTHLIPTD